jgi:hypothetical protein
MYIDYNMSAIAAVVGLCCCSSLSAAGGWFGGFISGTKPHFIKTVKISEIADIVKGLKTYKEEDKEYKKKAVDEAEKENVMDLNDEQKLELVRILKIGAENLRAGAHGGICDKVKEMYGSIEENKYQPIVDEYPDDIFTLSGSKRKKDVWENAVGLDDNFTRSDMGEGLNICLTSDEDFENTDFEFKLN